MPHIPLIPGEDELLNLGFPPGSYNHRGPHYLGVDFTAAESGAFFMPNPALVYERAAVSIWQQESIVGAVTAFELGIALPAAGPAALPADVTYEMRKIKVCLPNGVIGPLPFREEFVRAAVVRVRKVTLFQAGLPSDVMPEMTKPLDEPLELLVCDDRRIPDDYLCIGTRFLRQLFALKQDVDDFFSYKLRALRAQANAVCPVGGYSGSFTSP
jgi:hypothetical protein